MLDNVSWQCAMNNDITITFIIKIFARILTKYLPMARFGRFLAGLEAAGPRHWISPNVSLGA
jgi:hypothetical protein